MKLRRRYKRVKNEDDEECLIQNNHHRVHEHSKKVCDLPIVGWLVFLQLRILGTSMDMEICQGYMESI
jgi:hypothetical protein